MNNLLKNIKTALPNEIEGYICIKSQDVFIPYNEIGIECLVRDISDLSLFFEVIMKLADINVVDVEEIAGILGLDDKTLEEVIVDMVELNYISLSERKIKLTPQGRIALRENKSIEIKENKISQIAVNLITGEIIDGSTLYFHRNLDRGMVCMSEELKPDARYINLNFASIDRLLKIRQEQNSAFGTMSVTKELFRIIDLSYKDLVYVKKRAFLYIRKDSQEIKLIIESDPEDRYADCLYRQLSQGTLPCLENFFERDRFFSAYKPLYSPEQCRLFSERSNDLLSELIKNDGLTEDAKLYFEVSRFALFDNEYIYYFKESEAFDFDRVIICTNRVMSIITNEVISGILTISSKKKVIIIFEKDEFLAERTLKYHFLGKENIILIPSTKVSGSYICFDPYLEIRIFEQTVMAFNRATSFKTAHLCFREINQSERYNELVKQYSLNDQ